MKTVNKCKKLIKKLYKDIAEHYINNYASTDDALLIFHIGDNQRCPRILFLYESPKDSEENLLLFSDLLELANFLIDYDTDPTAYQIDIMYDVNRFEQDILKRYIYPYVKQELEDAWTKKIESGNVSGVTIIMTDCLS